MSKPEVITYEEAVARTTSMIAKASAWLVKHYPYIADTLYGLVPEPVIGIQTMGVTPGFVLYYDPVWLLSDPDIIGRIDGFVVLATDLYHECNHVLRNIERVEGLAKMAMTKGLNKKQANDLANIAADIPINDDIDADSNLKLQKWAYRAKTFDFPKGKTMEQYMSMLLRNPSKVQQKMKGKAGGGAGKKQGDDNDGKGGDGQNQPQGRPCAGGCGGIAGNPANEQLERELDKKYGRDEADRDHIKKSTYEKIERHQAQHGIGTTPGFSLEDIQFEKKPSKINWRRELNYVVRRATGRVTSGGTDYSLRRASKRSALLGVLRPGLIDQLPTVAFIRDTSASMGGEEINAANNESIEVMRRLGLDFVWFLDADTEAKGKPVRVRVRDIPRLEAKGRGGTNFIYPLETVHKMRPRPDVCIYLTDGWGPAPTKEPFGMKVVWCIVPRQGGALPAPWGHHVICSEDPEIHTLYEPEEESA